MFSRVIILFLALSASQHLSAQLVSGELMDENRQLLTETNFTLEGYTNGYFIITLAVDREGNVSSNKVEYSESTITATPLQMKAQEFVKTLKFEPGTIYPKFHHVKVKVNFKRS